MATPENALVHVFISYSHKDRRWLERLQVHLNPLTREYDIDLWDDTKLKPGSNWRKEIRSAVERANAAILIISADFLASDFVRTNELPPLLKAAEEEGTLILPIIAGPSLFLRNQDLSPFQAVNNPSRPLVLASEGEQESVFVTVAEAIIEKADTFRVESATNLAIDKSHQGEVFLNHSTWSRLIKIGDWIIDEEKNQIIGAGTRAYLLSREEYGESSFVIEADMEFTNFEPPQAQSLGMNSGIIFGWKSEGGTNRYYNIKISGSDVQIERIGFNGGAETRDFEHITDPTPLQISKGKEYKFEVHVNASEIHIHVNGERLQQLKRPTGVVGRVGLRPWRSVMHCNRFVINVHAPQA